MTGKFYWYQNGSVSTDKNNIVSYSDNSNSLFACNSFGKSTLKQTVGDVSAIIDYAGILTQNFINMSDTFLYEMVTKLNTQAGMDVDMNSHTLLIYAVKATYDTEGNATGYYIMCKLQETSSAVISYHTGTPYGFSESELSKYIPAVAIWPKGSEYTIEDIDKTDNTEGSFESKNDETGDEYKITFLGWSSEPNPHYEDCPENAEASTADDQWYFPGDEITPTDDMQFYAVWKPENHYEFADIKFTCEILDENGNVLDGETDTVTFKVDSRFAGYEYVICNEMGVPRGDVKVFKGGDEISMHHGDFLYINQVQTTEDPYIITCISGGYYASEEDAKTEIWATKAENTRGIFEAGFTAQWQAYTLTWDVDGTKTEEEYYYGDPVQSFPTPTKNGYTFAGWSAEVPETMPSHDLTLSALWNIDTYTISYDLDEDSGSAPAVNYTIVDSVILPSAGLQKSGFAFNGWKLSDDVADVGNWNSDTTYNGTLSGMYGSVTLIAQWVEKEYTITYDYAGGALPSGTPYIGGYETNETITFYAPIRNGYTFNGWKVTSTDGTWEENEIYTAGASISGVYGNVTLTAQWTPITYTITYDLAGGTENGVYVKTYTVESEDISIPNPLKQENEFLGWTGTGLGEPTKNLVIPKGSTGDRVYTATWGSNQYTITFDLANGRQPQTKTADYGSEITMPNTPTRDGYTFAGWKVTSTDGEWVLNTEYNGTTLTVLSGNVTLTAQWTPITYTITYDLAGGTAGGSYPEQYTVENADIQIPDPARLGYEFLGWTGTDLDSPTKNLVIPKGSTGDRAYTANWSAKEYTITFNTDGGTTIAAITQNYGTTIAKPINPTKDGFVFVGWDKAIPDTMPAENITITALWKIAETTMTIQVLDAIGTFIFRITGEGVDVTVTVESGKKVTIGGLLVGRTYTITDTGWNWRYEVATQAITVGSDPKIVELKPSPNDSGWLGGEG